MKIVVSVPVERCLEVFASVFVMFCRVKSRVGVISTVVPPIIQARGRHTAVTRWVPSDYREGHDICPLRRVDELEK